METGFKQEEVTYEPTFDSNDFETSLFGANYSANFDFPWALSDEEHLNGVNLDSLAEETVHQDDFNKTFDSWQQHISNLKIEKDFILPDEELVDNFTVSNLDELLTPSLDQDNLFADLIPSVPTPASSLVQWSNVKIKEEPKDETELLNDQSKPSQNASSDNSVDSSGVAVLAQTQPLDGVKIKIEKVEKDAEDDVVDVETVSDAIPCFPTGNSVCKLEVKRHKQKDGKAKKTSNQAQGKNALKVPPRNDSLLQAEEFPVDPLSGLSPGSPAIASPKNAPSNKTIMNSLPKEIVDRIKKSIKKKKPTVVPAEPLLSKANSHMKDAGFTKIVKPRELREESKSNLASAQSTCTTNIATKIRNTACDSGAKLAPPPIPSPRPAIPVIMDAFSVTEEDKWVLDNEQKLLSCAPTASPSPSEASSVSRNNWEKNSKRDSGLESGDVSDASESPSDKKSPPSVQVVPAARIVKIEKEDCNVSKPNQMLIHTESPQALEKNYTEVPNVIRIDDDSTDGKKSQGESSKKKLNLIEYRNRMKIAQLSGPIKTGTFLEELLYKQNIPCSPKTDIIEGKRSEEHVAKPSVPEARATTPPKSYDIERRKRKSRSRDRIKSRHGYRSSSSSSHGSSPGSCRRSSHRRGRSRDKRRKESKKSKKNRSPSSPRSRTHSFSRSSSSQSRSRSKSRSCYSKRGSRYRVRSRSRSRSPYMREPSNYRYPPWTPNDRPARQYDDYNNVERQKQVEERRVVYVGRIEEGTTKSQLRERFQRFGHIVDISLHFRERGDNYGFVTFASKSDAYKAVEHGNDNPKETRYDICFGGRRAFCKQRYADLDSMAPLSTYSPFHQSRPNEDFDSLFRAVQQKILRSKNV